MYVKSNIAKEPTYAKLVNCKKQMHLVLSYDLIQNDCLILLYKITCSKIVSTIAQTIELKPPQLST